MRQAGGTGQEHGIRSNNNTQDINRKIEQEEEGRKTTTRGVTMKENESMKNNEEEDKNEIAKCN